jgi:dTDP-4-dehydrorhamnose reductase
MRVLVLGASGMIGSEVLRWLKRHSSCEVWGLLRDSALLKYFSLAQQETIITGVDMLDESALSSTLDRVRPDVLINCAGLIKQKDTADDPLVVLPINAMLPHSLAVFCASRNIRLLQISTDCVFSGRKGMYTETDPSDAEYLYGKSKYIGELHNHKFALTLRVSTIGHELNSRYALLDWFLSRQDTAIIGYRRSIFSGITVTELARVICEVVLPNSSLYGLYHLSSAPISKFELLRLVAAQYGKAIEVLPNDELVINRSLDSSKFFQATGYRAPSWESMLRLMYEEKYKIES